MIAKAEPDTVGAREELDAFARKGGALVSGVAAAVAFAEAPAGAHPADLLPGARSVLVVGGAQPRAGDWASPIPGHLETMGTSERINSLGLKLAKYIEERYGYYALFVPPGLNQGNRPFLSVAHAAAQSGCGSRSLAGPVLHPEFGFMYYAAIVTTLPLPPAPPLETPACPAPECVEMYAAEGATPCMAVCPIDEGGCIGGRIEEGRIVQRRYDAARCTTRVYTYWVPGFQKALEAALNEPDSEKRAMILHGSFFTRTLWSITYAAQCQAQCFECMRVCPVGRAYREKK